MTHLTIFLLNSMYMQLPFQINLFIIVIYCPPAPIGDFLEELGTLLSLLSTDNTPLMVLCDFDLTSGKLQYCCLQTFLNFFFLTFNSFPPTHKGKMPLIYPSPIPLQLQISMIPYFTFLIITWYPSPSLSLSCI